MIRLVFSFLILFGLHQSAVAQTEDQNNENAVSEASLIQEQAAICAAFARVMEYSGLLEENRGKLWRERRFYAGAILRQSITETSNEEPSNAMIDGVINQYSGWMINLFSATSGVSDKGEIEERDKLKDYISTLCTPLFVNADKAIARIRPDLFNVETIQQPVSTETAEASEGSILGDVDESINKLMDENMTLRARIAMLEKSLSSKDGTPEGEETVMAGEIASDNASIDAELIAGTVPDITALSEAVTTKSGADSQMTDVTIPEDEQPDMTTPPGRMQVQLAAYSNLENAQRGMTILQEEIPTEFSDIRFSITTATLASGKNVFRIVSTPLEMDTAKSICTHFWSLQYGCIIKMNSNS